MKRKNKKNLDFHKKFNETKNIISENKNLSRFFAGKNFYKNIKNIIGIITAGLVCIFLVLAFMAIYQKIYQNYFFAGVVLADNNLSGKTYEEAKEIISEQADEFSRQGITVVYEDKKVNITAAPIANSPDLSFDLFHFDTTGTLNKIFAIGRRQSFVKSIQEQIAYFMLSPHLPMDYQLDEEKLLDILRENFSEFENPAQNATISIDKNNDLKVQAETHGTKFDYKNIIEHIKYKIAYLDNEGVAIELKTDYPETYAQNIEPTLQQAKIVLGKAPYFLAVPEGSVKNAGKEFKIDKDTLASLLGAKKDSFFRNKYIIGLKTEESVKYFEDNISEFIDVEPIDAKFEIKNGKVVEFASSKNGQKLNIASTTVAFEEVISEIEPAATTTKIMLVVDEVESEITNESVNDLGIKELIGTGHSNFAGSPPNRRHNIRIGAAAVNGTLIKPDEEFSLLKTLGNIDSASGYLPELVIKGNETIPEYGGGLCQIGTTVFRGTTESGLPVTARRNHSYRVSYYEPAGTDATIYDPAPDFKFLNDTGSYVLIQSRIEGNDLYFDFWGTDDGRKVTKTKPVIYNITSPPPTKIVETDTLAPGEKKCTESAHNGADAYFDYMVEYSEGETKEVRFSSHYRPWQEVCLVGVEKTSTSTPEILKTED